MARLQRPPGPTGGVFGCFEPLRRDSLRFLAKVARDYGDIAYFRAANQQIYFVNEPGLIQDVLVNKSSHFIKGSVMQRAKMLLGNGLLTNEGSSHLRQRRLVQPAFHHEHLASYGRVMTELAARTRDRWSDGQTIDVDREMRQLTLAIVGRTLFGADIETDTPQIGEAM
ncbi:MAG TPA: cytochrome P450, partial [Bryobacteraceae bacterium]